MEFINGMTKIKIKSYKMPHLAEYFQPWSCFVLSANHNHLYDLIDMQGLRVQLSEIIRSLMSVNFCGGIIDKRRNQASYRTSAQYTIKPSKTTVCHYLIRVIYTIT